MSSFKALQVHFHNVLKETESNVFLFKNKKSIMINQKCVPTSVFILKGNG